MYNVFNSGSQANSFVTPFQLRMFFSSNSDLDCFRGSRALRTCPLKSWRFPRNSPTCRSDSVGRVRAPSVGAALLGRSVHRPQGPRRMGRATPPRALTRSKLSSQDSEGWKQTARATSACYVFLFFFGGLSRLDFIVSSVC